MADWMAALDRLQKGMQDPGGQTLRSAPTRLEQFGSDFLGQLRRNFPGVGDLFEPPGNRPHPQEGVEALHFGSVGDPVSQLAFMLAPQLLSRLPRGIGPGARNPLSAGRIVIMGILIW